MADEEVTCPECVGSGEDGGITCPNCQGTGHDPELCPCDVCEQKRASVGSNG